MRNLTYFKKVPHLYHTSIQKKTLIIKYCFSRAIKAIMSRTIKTLFRVHRVRIPVECLSVCPSVPRGRYQLLMKGNISRWAEYARVLGAAEQFSYITIHTRPHSVRLETRTIFCQAYFVAIWPCKTVLWVVSPGSVNSINHCGSK